jgi:hypothetical protein
VLLRDCDPVLVTVEPIDRPSSVLAWVLLVGSLPLPWVLLPARLIGVLAVTLPLLPVRRRDCRGRGGGTFRRPCLM